MLARIALILSLLLTPVAIQVEAQTVALARKPAPDGNYAVSIRGYYTGTGSAGKAGKAVTIDATVSAGGQQGTLSATLVVNGTYVSGDGTVMGKKLTLTGRLDDPGDPSQGKGLRSARLTATFTDEGGNHGRIAGAIPLAPGKGHDDDTPPPPAQRS